MATGLLILVLGAATRWQSEIADGDKTYRGRFKLGVTSDTDDSTGKTLEIHPVPPLSLTEVQSAMAAFVGTIEQTVPLYAAVKVKGRPLYEWARKGIPVIQPRRIVTVHRFHLSDYRDSEGEFSVVCSKGTYIRSLVRDVGNKLGTGAVMTALRRERIGRYDVSGAYPWRTDKPPSPEETAKSFIPNEAYLEVQARAT